jgi:hypothetical protein
MRAHANFVTLVTVIALSCLAGVACSRRDASGAASSAASASSAPPGSSGSLSPRAAGAEALVEVAVPAGVERCGPLGCLAFAEATTAFRYVLAHDPRVLAIGEAHARKGTESIASSTKRFTETLLPELRDRAVGLVLELWLAEPRCGKAVEVVRDQQKPVTSGQAKTNPNELVALGDRAYALGIRPYPLHPSCEDYAPIVNAADAGAGGGGAVGRMLELIERLSEQRMKSLLASTADAGARDLVLAYGGALHNDVAPKPGNEGFSFGPAMMHATGGRYVELDLIVGDFVRDEEPWTALPWVKPYLLRMRETARARAHDGGAADETLLYRPGPASFVLVFPRTRP